MRDYRERQRLLARAYCIRQAIDWTKSALRNVAEYGGRTDCLNVALLHLEGALRNVVEEELPNAEREVSRGTGRGE